MDGGESRESGKRKGFTRKSCLQRGNREISKKKISNTTQNMLFLNWQKKKVELYSGFDRFSILYK